MAEQALAGRFESTEFKGRPEGGIRRKCATDTDLNNPALPRVMHALERSRPGLHLSSGFLHGVHQKEGLRA